MKCQFSEQTKLILAVSYSFFLLLAAAPVGVTDAALVGGRLDSFDNPKQLYFDGPETMAIDTYAKAKEFCKSKGNRLLARKDEWCEFYHDGDWHKRMPWGGQRKTEQWVPVRLWSNNYNNYLLIGPLNGTDYSQICRDWHHIGGHGTPRKWRVRHALFCGRPEVCLKDESRCLMTCPETAPKGFYPDPNDCQSYCYCAGEGKVSWWESVESKGLVWDPYCHNSKSLYGNNSDPLGGMTGGCPNHDYYLDDKSYCSPAERRGRRLELDPSNYKPEPHTSQHHGGRRELTEVPDGPQWGIDEDKPPFETNAIMCTQWPQLPQQPKTCANVWGDPHIVTFDGLAYDCQGSGDYILTKSLTSGFEIQGRFHKFDTFQATTMTGFVVKTDRNDEPDLEFSLWGRNMCHTKFIIGGEEVNVFGKYNRNGTISTGTEKIHFVHRGGPNLVWPETGITIKFDKKHSKALGCYINMHICIDDEIVTKEPLVGLLGSPYGNRDNDFMAMNGTDLAHQGKIHWEDSYNYCKNNWCIEDGGDSLFTDPMVSGQCDLPYDPYLENQVKHATPELKKICEGNAECMIEGSAGDVKDSTDSMVKVRELKEKKEVYLEEDPLTWKDPNPEEHDEIVERTTAEGAHDPYDSPPKGGNAYGDPHMTAWDGTKFDFHGQCDLLFLANDEFANGLGLHVHIRTKIDTWWSFIETAAVKLGGHTLEITGGKKHTPYWLDGEEVADMETGDASLGDFPVHFKRHSEQQTQTRIDLLHGNALSIETYKRFVRINVKVGDDAFKLKGTYGILGAFPNGQLVGRDGKTIFTDMDEFGQEWQVLSTEPKIFHSENDIQHPAKCAMPTQTNKSTKRRLGEAVITEEEASSACAHVTEDELDSCIFDVLATGDKDMAGSY